METPTTEEPGDEGEETVEEDQSSESDDYGYGPQTEDEPSEDDESEDGEEIEEKEDDKKKEEKKKRISGYDDVEETEDEPAEEKKEDEKKKTDEELSAEEKIDKEITETLKDIGDQYDAQAIKTFALENKFTPAQVKAYKEMLKKEEADLAKAQKAAQKAQRAAWTKELREDKEFGGVNFDKNVDRVEKLLENHMPNVKKVLTEKGGMLPPWLVRDLSGLAKALNPKNKFVDGNPVIPKKEKSDNFLDDMYK